MNEIKRLKDGTIDQRQAIKIGRLNNVTDQYARVGSFVWANYMGNRTFGILREINQIAVPNGKIVVKVAFFKYETWDAFPTGKEHFYEPQDVFPAFLSDYNPCVGQVDRAVRVVPNHSWATLRNTLKYLLDALVEALDYNPRDTGLLSTANRSCLRAGGEEVTFERLVSACEELEAAGYLVMQKHPMEDGDIPYRLTDITAEIYGLK